MNNIKSIFTVLVAFVGFTLSNVAVAEKTNFSYTSIGADIGSVTYKTPICGGGQCLSSFTAVSLDGSVQFADDLLVVFLSGSGIAGSGNVWTMSGGNSAIGLGIVKAIGDKVDIQARIASLSSRVEFCVGNTCATATDTGSGFGGGLNFWLDDTKNLSGNISYQSSKYSLDTKSTETLGVGLGYYFSAQNEFYGQYGSNDYASTFAVGFTHHF